MTDELTGATLLALRNLCSDEGLNTAEAIATAEAFANGGPYSAEEIGTSEIREGLYELERLRLARESNGIWELTDAGRERCG